MVPSAVTQQGGMWHAWHGVHLAGKELAFQSVTGKEMQARWLGMGTQRIQQLGGDITCTLTPFPRRARGGTKKEQG